MRTSLSLLAVVSAVMAGTVASARGAGATTPPASINGRYGVNVSGFLTINIPAVGTRPAQHITKSVKERSYVVVSSGALLGHPIAMFNESHGNVKFSVNIPGGTGVWSFIFSKDSSGWGFIGSAHIHAESNGVTTVGTFGYGGQEGRVELQPTSGGVAKIPRG